MRAELEEIEKIERFLEGKMEGQELSGFESAMESDGALRAKVAEQKELISRVNHVGRKKAMNVAHTAHLKKQIMLKYMKVGGVAVGVTGAAIAGTTQLNDADYTPENEPEKVEVAVTESTSNEVSDETYQFEPSSVEPEDTTEKAAPDTVKEEVQESRPQEEKKVETTEEPPQTEKKTGKYVVENAQKFREKGTKMYITTNDYNAKTHFIRELKKYDTWQIAYEKEKADYEVKLFEEMVLVDRMVWIEIVDIKTGDILYMSEKARGLDRGIRTPNLKQQAVYNLVHDILRYEFFTK